MPSNCRFEAELELCKVDGGVCDPNVEPKVELDLVVGITLPLLEFESVDDLSVRKLALDSLRKSLRKEGAMVYSTQF